MPSGDQLAFSILSSQMVRTIDSNNFRLSVNGLVGHEVNLDEYLHQLVLRIADVMKADRGTLYLVDFPRSEIFSRAAHLPELKQIRLKIGQGVAGHVAQNGKVVNIPSATQERLFHPDIDKLTGYRTTSLLAVPLIDARDAVFGVLQVLNKAHHETFNAADELKLIAIANQVSQALQATTLYTELRRAQQQPEQKVSYFFNKVIGESTPMRAIYKSIHKAAQSNATVLLRGESGTGKELFARAVHVNSPRRDKPFIKVDCTALPAGLIENELFGHEKGAFTGAQERQPGKFEAAEGGTVFIDELGELPFPVQGKLLRVLQDREFERVGGTRTVHVDVRIVAATHRDLPLMVKEGRFREDLYYRVKVVEIAVPALRTRGQEDIERLTRHFIAQATKRHHLSQEPQLTEGALQRLLAWHWPGNVRELENCIESAVVLSEGEVLAEHLPLPVPPFGGSTKQASTAIVSLAEAEKRHIQAALERAEGNRTLAAQWLDIGRNTLLRKLKQYNLGQ
jgi:Nif-specific regulatory protein